MKEIESRDEKIMNINKNVDNIYKDVVILKESNPQSKNLQKIIQKLTDKVSLIDSHFKFNLPK
jgi:archaellum component FlaC